ncbi:MAG: tRNA pseudouridine(55) synthase TruB [Ignavibacteriaceae bacterium]|nr:tRNA pseudouridine(55) synthase TruB [Ignavibacteriaceae bacterium]
MIAKNRKEKTEFNFLKGEALLIDKPLNWSSFKVVHELRKIIGVKKIGHAGTLDPRATGLLILCTGKMTKSIDGYQGMPKVYTGDFMLGKRTKTMDTESEPYEEKSVSHLTPDLIINATKKFTGRILQVPPMYSAVNHQGSKLYQLAKKGEHVERKPREIEITEFTITEINLPIVKFRIACSKGTYIRVIAEDYGLELGCGAYLHSLRRTAIGEYKVDDAFTMSEFKQHMSEIRTNDQISMTNDQSL